MYKCVSTVYCLQKDEEQTNIRYESGDLFAILDQLYTHTFSDSRVRLFSFDADFFQDNALCMG